MIHAGGSLAGNELIEALLTTSYAESALPVCKRSFAVIGEFSSAVAEGLCVLGDVNEFFILVSSYSGSCPVSDNTPSRQATSVLPVRYHRSRQLRLRHSIASDELGLMRTSHEAMAVEFC